MLEDPTDLIWSDHELARLKRIIQLFKKKDITLLAKLMPQAKPRKKKERARSH